jgi:hypothetical protein
LDSCEGEIISREDCVKRARMIVDNDVCEEQCKRDKHPDDDKLKCDQVCRQPMNPPNHLTSAFDPARGGAAYAADYIRHPEGSSPDYTFPVIEETFAGIRTMGLQPHGYAKRSALSGATEERPFQTGLEKAENPFGIATTTSVNWLDQTDRTIVYVGAEPATWAGEPVECEAAGSGHAMRCGVTTTARDEQSRTTWTTPW